jgi:hypothetical protein
MSKMPSEYVMAKKENINGSTTIWYIQCVS